MANSADQDQFFRSQLIWISTVCNGRVYPGSAGQGLIKMLLLWRGKIDIDYIRDSPNGIPEHGFMEKLETHSLEDYFLCVILSPDIKIPGLYQFYHNHQNLFSRIKPRSLLET